MSAVLAEPVRHDAWLEPLFDVTFTAPDGIARLRQLILTLAMQGKLVAQDPADEPAGILLKRSRAEIAKAMEVGDAKREKPALPLAENEKSFNLPGGWEWCRLVDMGQFINGAAFKPSDWGKAGRPIIRIQNLSGRNTKFNRTQKEFDPSILVQDGDILVSWSATLDAFVWRGEEGVLNQHIFRVLKAALADKGYLFWLLKWVIRKLAESDHAHGLVMTHINRGPFLAHPIPLPPLNEQKRIVARIDELMTRCDDLERLRQQQTEKRAAARAATVRQWLAGDEIAAQLIGEHFATLISTREDVAGLRKAVLQLAVMGKLVPQDAHDAAASELLKQIAAEKAALVKAGKIRAPKPLEPIADAEKPYAIPASWEWVRLGSLAVYGPNNGFSPKPVDYETKIKTLSLSATTSGKFNPAFHKFVEVKIANDSELWLQDGDILIQRGNALEYVGVPAVYRGSSNEFIYPDLMMRIRLGEFLDVDYVYAAMSSDWCRSYLRERASGTSGTMPKISQDTLKKLIVPLPPLAEQKRIVARIDELMQLCDTLEQRIDAAQAKQAELLEAVMARV